MKKLLLAILSVALMGVMAVSVAACGGGENGGSTGGNEKPPIEQPGTEQPGTEQPGGNEQHGNAVDTTVSDVQLKLEIGERKIYLVGIGRSGEEGNASTILKNKAVGLAADRFEVSSDKTADQVEANSIVIIVPGISAKGLGGAGVNAAAEIERARGFAARTDITIIVMQIGGDTRRGADSDQLYSILCPVAHVNLVVSSADNDKKFTNEWCANSPLYLYSRSSSMAASLKFILGL